MYQKFSHIDRITETFKAIISDLRKLGENDEKDIIILSGLHGFRSGENYVLSDKNEIVSKMHCEEFFDNDKRSLAGDDRVCVKYMPELKYDEISDIYLSEKHHVILGWCWFDVDIMFREIILKKCDPLQDSYLTKT